MKDNLQMIMRISTMEDIQKLKENESVKYINLDITTPNLEVIYYLINNGQKYSYTDLIDNHDGYIYVPYETFKKSELLILEIIKNIDPNLTELEISRLLYITLGNKIGYDINILPDKNETFNLQNISTLNNIWGSYLSQKGTNISFAKLYLYLCRLMNINCKIISKNNTGYLKNELLINNQKIITDITQDIPYIQSKFQTRYFLGYNDNIELDKKINYIQDDYSEKKIESSLRTLDYTSSNLIKDILLNTQNIITANTMNPIELGIIYNEIFTKYCPNYEIYINNLYLNDLYNTKEHFILITYKNKCYSYNYKKNTFQEISYQEIEKNLNDKKIGIYLNEKIPSLPPKSHTI